MHRISFGNLDMQKKVIDALMENMDDEGRKELMAFGLNYVKKEDVLGDLDKSKDNRINYLLKELEESRPSNNSNHELAKLIALRELDSKGKFDDDYGYESIKKIVVSLKGRDTYDVVVHYVSYEGYCEEYETTVKRGQELSCKLR